MSRQATAWTRCGLYMPSGRGLRAISLWRRARAVIGTSLGACLKRGPYVTSPVLYKGLYYTLLDGGIFTCHDAKTGRVVYDKQRIDPSASAFSASPWAYNDRIFCLSEEGDTYVIQAGPEFKVLGKNVIDDVCLASPAIANGSLILRTFAKLYRIGTTT